MSFLERNDSRKASENGSEGFTSLAHWISALGFAPVLSIPAFLILVTQGRLLDFHVTYEVLIALLFGCILPSLTMFAFVRIKRISYDDRESRLVPLLSVAFVYFAGTFLIASLHMDPFAILLMFCYGTNTLLIYVINLRWKISVHAMGVSGPTSALLFAIGPTGGVLGLLMLPVVWSRLYLKKHTSGQAAAGGLLGYLFTSAQFAFLGNTIFHKSMDWISIVLLIAVLAMPFVVYSFYKSFHLFRYLFLIMVIVALLLGILIIFLGRPEMDFLLIANISLFLAMLFLPESEKSGKRLFHGLLSMQRNE